MNHPQRALLPQVQAEPARSPTLAQPHSLPAAFLLHAGTASFLRPRTRRKTECCPPTCPSSASSAQTGAPSAYPGHSTAPPAALPPETALPLSLSPTPYNSSPESASPKSAAQFFRNPLSQRLAAFPFLSRRFPFLLRPSSLPLLHRSRAPGATANPSEARQYIRCLSPADRSSASTCPSSAPRPCSTKSRDTS